MRQFWRKEKEKKRNKNKDAAYSGRACSGRLKQPVIFRVSLMALRIQDASVLGGRLSLSRLFWFGDSITM